MKILSVPYTAGQIYLLLGLGFSLLGALGGLVVSLAATPLYKADARLLVSTTGGAPVSNASYQEAAASQQIALSLVQLASSTAVTERVVNSLELDVSPSELAADVQAAVEPETVIINLAVTNSSGALAREIANATAFEFSDFVEELQLKTAPSTPRPQVTLVQPAVTPLAPISPSMRGNVGLGGLAGLTAGLILANFRLRMNRSVRDVATLQSIAGEPSLGSIPILRSNNGNPTMVVTDGVFVVESIKEVRTNLIYSLKDGPSGVVSVSSAGPEEGTTMTVIGVATALSDAGRHVVVVDADLRGADLTNRLGAADKYGLSETLAGMCELEDVVHSLDSRRRIDIVPAGGASPRPSELLSSEDAEKLFLRLGSMYDFVIVDTPPLLTFTDGAVVATHCDGVVLVVRYGRVRSDELETAVANLKKVGARILGPVFTFAPEPKLSKRTIESRIQRRSGRPAPSGPARQRGGGLGQAESRQQPAMVATGERDDVEPADRRCGRDEHVVDLDASPPGQPRGTDHDETAPAAAGGVPATDERHPEGYDHTADGLHLDEPGPPAGVAVGGEKQHATAVRDSVPTRRPRPRPPELE